MKPVIITTITNPQGTSVALYRQGRAYHVGVLSSHRRPVPLADSTFWTYEAAHERLMAEAQARQNQ